MSSSKKKKSNNCEKRRNPDTRKENGDFEHLKADKACVGELKTKDIKSKTIDTKNINIQEQINANIISANNIFLGGQDLGCLLNNGAPYVTISQSYDCKDCDGNPIKPDKIDQDVWDFLECNRKAYQLQIEADNLAGREEIRCIKQAYDCGPDCPADCFPPPTCIPIFTGTIDDTTLIVESIEPNTGSLFLGSNITSYDSNNNIVLPGTYIVNQISGPTGGVGSYEIFPSQNVVSGSQMIATFCPTVQPGATGPCTKIPPECIEDWNTCDLFVQNNLFNTITVPFLSLSQFCNLLPENAKNQYISKMNYSLNINNVSCTLGTRNATVLVHYAYKEENPVPIPPYVNPCQECPGTAEPEPVVCIADQGGLECQNLPSNIACGLVDIQVKQIYYTININIGENFANVVPIPTFILETMLKATSPIDYDNVKGALQMAIFLEDGLSVSNNSTARGNCDAGCAALTAFQTLDAICNIL